MRANFNLSHPGCMQMPGPAAGLDGTLCAMGRFPLRKRGCRTSPDKRREGEEDSPRAGRVKRILSTKHFMLKQEVSHVQRVKFEEKELTKVGENGTAPIFDTPITPAENFLAVFAGKNPLWMPMTTDTRNFTPRIDI